MIIFTIVIPCFNEAEHIGKCLSSLNNQNFPRDQFEILVVDNGSEDASVEISQALADRTIEYPDGKVGAVRNRGASEAKGENLVFIDADCTLDDDWLNRALELISRNEKTAFGGGCLLPPNASWIERCWLLEGREGNTLPRELIGCSIVLQRELFEKMDGFNEGMSSGEDSELSRRLKIAGNSVSLKRALNVVHWGNAKTQNAFLKRQIWHAKSYASNLRNNMCDPIFLLAGLFTALATLGGLSLFLAPKASMLALMFALSLPAILTAKRFKRVSRIPCSLSEAANSYYLDLLYLAGRSIGLSAVLLSQLRPLIYLN
ncbi:glycosyltransferase [Marinobacter sp. NFXS11]|uniref:glycosyltransferase n=1 Tax=Marinobacter sp. NFXS11 TaxID=2818432 RepID=UPI0032DFB735